MRYEDRPGDDTEAIHKPTPRTNTQDTAIYRRGAPLYRAAGWAGVCPLRARTKTPPPTGFTGWQGVDPDDEQIETWIRTQRALANLMLRLSPGQLGIDVDDYEGKNGGKTLAEAIRRWWPLPPTYRNSARADDPVSGHLLYAVPQDLVTIGDIKFGEGAGEIGDIELIQPHHRFVVCWPSVHPKTGQRYRWYAPDGSLMPEGEVPRADDLPELPEAWVEGLRKKQPSPPHKARQQRDRQVTGYDLSDAMTPGEASPSVLHTLKNALRDLGWKP